MFFANTLYHKETQEPLFTGIHLYFHETAVTRRQIILSILLICSVKTVFQPLLHQDFCSLSQGAALHCLPGGKHHDHLSAFWEENYAW